MIDGILGAYPARTSLIDRDINPGRKKKMDFYPFYDNESTGMDMPINPRPGYTSGTIFSYTRYHAVRGSEIQPIYYRTCSS